MDAVAAPDVGGGPSIVCGQRALPNMIADVFNESPQPPKKKGLANAVIGLVPKSVFFNQSAKITGVLGRIAYPRDGYSPGMFWYVKSVKDLAFVLGVRWVGGADFHQRAGAKDVGGGGVSGVVGQRCRFVVKLRSDQQLGTVVRLDDDG